MMNEKSMQTLAEIFQEKVYPAVRGKNEERFSKVRSVLAKKKAIREELSITNHMMHNVWMHIQEENIYTEIKGLKKNHSAYKSINKEELLTKEFITFNITIFEDIPIKKEKQMISIRTLEREGEINPNISPSLLYA